VQYHPLVGPDPYGVVIERFIGQEFPQLASGAVEDTLEAMMRAFLATKQYRVGPVPNPESLVRVIQRRPLALGLALVYTVGLLLAIYVTLWRAP
jgi:hypothetical protein